MVAERKVFVFDSVIGFGVRAKISTVGMPESASAPARRNVSPGWLLVANPVSGSIDVSPRHAIFESS